CAVTAPCCRGTAASCGWSSPSSCGCALSRWAPELSAPLVSPSETRSPPTMSAPQNPTPLKQQADDDNEIHDVATFQDAGRNAVTPVAQFPEPVALAVVNAFADIVTRAGQSAAATTPDSDGIVRSQTFEEGDVYMIEKPFDGFFADRYIMDFYDVAERDICSRMHLHTGLRFVRMMTGPGTRIRVGSLSPFAITDVPGVPPFRPATFEDDLPDTPAGVHRTRYNLIVPPCSFVDMQIPRGVSHQ